VIKNGGGDGPLGLKISKIASLCKSCYPPARGGALRNQTTGGGRKEVELA
jgi:hypothetical protein